MRQKIDLPAILEKDLRILLGRLGISAEIEAGTIYCPTCCRPITWDTLGGFIVRDGKPVLFCDASDCLEASRCEE